MTQDGSNTINVDYVANYSVGESSGGAQVVAELTSREAPLTLGRYGSAAEARNALNALYNALLGEETGFRLPDSELLNE